RAIPTGVEAVIRSAMQNLNIDEKQTQQLVFKFGLGKDTLQGQIYNAIINTVDLLTTDIEKSIKVYATRYPNARIDRTLVTGGSANTQYRRETSAGVCVYVWTGQRQTGGANLQCHHQHR